MLEPVNLEVGNPPYLETSETLIPMLANTSPSYDKVWVRTWSASAA